MAQDVNPVPAGKFRAAATCRRGHINPLRYENNGACVECVKAPRTNARRPTCHVDRRHRAKGLCRPCYDKAYKAKPSACHPDREVHSNGQCSSCYSKAYRAAHRPEIKDYWNKLQAAGRVTAKFRDSRFLGLDGPRSYVSRSILDGLGVSDGISSQAYRNYTVTESPFDTWSDNLSALRVSPVPRNEAYPVAA